MSSLSGIMPKNPFTAISSHYTNPSGELNKAKIAKHVVIAILCGALIAGVVVLTVHFWPVILPSLLLIGSHIAPVVASPIFHWALIGGVAGGLVLGLLAFVACKQILKDRNAQYPPIGFSYSFSWEKFYWTYIV